MESILAAARNLFEDEHTEEDIIERADEVPAVEAADFVNEDDDDDDEDEIIDPRETLKASCSEKPECAKLGERLATCTARVEGRENTTETCQEELQDFIHCVDHCVSHSLFKHLK